MYTREKALEFLRENLDPWRMEHSVRVMETAIRLAHIHEADQKKAEMAGLLHDSGKWKSREITLQKINEWGIILNEEEKLEYNLVHARLGAYIAGNIFDIEDEDVLNAIRYHVTGRPAMSKLEKIVYIADMIEPARNYPGVDDFRQVAEENLDQAILSILDENIIYLIGRGSYIAIDSLRARNYFILKNNKEI